MVRARRIARVFFTRRSVGTNLALAKCSFNYVITNVLKAKYSVSLLLRQDSHSAGNVLAHDSDLSKFGRSTLGDLSNTQLHVIPIITMIYLRKLLLERLNLVHELITVLLTKFNGLHSGYAIKPPSIKVFTHFSISIALFAGRKGQEPLEYEL